MTSSLPLPVRFASFVLVGGVCLVANTAVLWGLTAGLGIHYLLSTVIAFCAITPLGFLLNKVVTFRTRREHAPIELPRYFAAMREVSPRLIDKLVHYDTNHAMASIAIEEATGRMLGVVRLHDDSTGAAGEFAILVRSRLKGHGLGWLLMKHMIAYAKEKGLKAVRGEVLSENTSMLMMCRELGFHAHDDPNERYVKQVELRLDEVPKEALH